jgi:hypothetical protein
MLKFLIKVQGQKPFRGIFASSRAAQAMAEQRFPHAPPACVLCLSRMEQGRAA